MLKINTDTAFCAQSNMAKLGKIARDHGLVPIHIETDSLLAVREIEKGHASSCDWGSIVCDICNSLKVGGLGSVCYVRKEANYAHNMAKLTVEGADDVLW
ncbi:hypothetical protein CRYUN_Cryun24cG0033700 [Craigia yunnanensis]